MSRSRAAPILLALLIAASGLSFLRAEQLKLQHSALQHPHIKQSFSPTCSGPRCHRQAVLEFTLGAAQPVGLKIVDADGNTVRSLTDGEVQTPKGKVTVRWDGTTTRAGSCPTGATAWPSPWGRRPHDHDPVADPGRHPGRRPCAMTRVDRETDAW